VETDAAKKMTVLKAEEAPWEKIAGTYSMDFGSASIAPGTTNRLIVRGVNDFINSAATGDASDKSTNISTVRTDQGLLDRLFKSTFVSKGLKYASKTFRIKPLNNNISTDGNSDYTKSIEMNGFTLGKENVSVNIYNNTDQ
jgi:hypothetical protein